MEKSGPAFSFPAEVNKLVVPSLSFPAVPKALHQNHKSVFGRYCHHPHFSLILSPLFLLLMLAIQLPSLHGFTAGGGGIDLNAWEGDSSLGATGGGIDFNYLLFEQIG